MGYKHTLAMLAIASAMVFLDVCAFPQELSAGDNPGSKAVSEEGEGDKKRAIEENEEDDRAAGDENGKASAKEEGQEDANVGEEADESKGRVDLSLVPIIRGKLITMLTLPGNSGVREELSELFGDKPKLVLNRATLPEGVLPEDKFDVLTSKGVERIEFVHITRVNSSNAPGGYQYILESEEAKVPPDTGITLADGDYALAAPAGQMSPKASVENFEVETPPKEVASKLWKLFVADFDGQDLRDLEEVAGDGDHLARHIKFVPISFGQLYEYAAVIKVDTPNSFSAFYLIDKTADTVVELEPPVREDSSVEILAVADLDGDGSSGLLYGAQKIAVTNRLSIHPIYSGHARWVEVIDGKIEVREVTRRID